MDLSISPLTAETGAEVRGLDLAQPLEAALRQRLNAVFSDRSVLVFRDQHLSPAQLLEAARQFGDVFTQYNPRTALPDCPLVHYISNEDFYPDGRRYIPGAGWHTDHSNAPEPPKATLLHAVALPDHGGDTQFANMHLAWQALTAQMQQSIAGLKAVHMYQSRFSERKLMVLPEEAKQVVPDGIMHPLVRTHPESGRKAIYLNPIRTEAIPGMPEAEALGLLDRLLAHATGGQFEYRHKWQRGDVVMWDNRCLLHKANADYDMAQRRYLYRLMLQGDRPR